MSRDTYVLVCFQIFSLYSLRGRLVLHVGSHPYELKSNSASQPKVEQTNKRLDAHWTKVRSVSSHRKWPDFSALPFRHIFILWNSRRQVDIKFLLCYFTSSQYQPVLAWITWLRDFLAERCGGKDVSWVETNTPPFPHYSTSFYHSICLLFLLLPSPTRLGSICKDTSEAARQPATNFSHQTIRRLGTRPFGASLMVIDGKHERRV